ncbi:hypothetical protein [Deminuibacter soli]|uniref:Uncharacterized protein n=1 Tax=Deminuibacter soli TaxID=2291815 RepID=A0A3E1NQ01_9BACT|nr:hypothetical protein [Deminuibacter soli]RFM30006.1 hypothetical protein DXN05_03270 [Deminuibacter soli]
MGRIIFRAKKLTETSKAASWIADNGNLHLQADKANVMQKGNEGVHLKIGDPPKADTAVPEVAAIKISTPLDQGINNSGAAVNGMLFDHRYIFEVTAFKNGTPPASENLIKWAYAYTTPEGQVIKNWLQGAFGKKIMLHIAAHEACGTQLTISAFIKQPDKGASITTWVHNRFRWFPRNQLQTQISQTQQAPEKIDQNSTPLCGIAALGYLLVKDDAAGYANLLLNLHRKGEYLYKTFLVKPLDEQLYDMVPDTGKNPGYPHNAAGPMRMADWLLLASVKNSEVKAYEGKQGEEWDGITWPWDVLPLLKKLLNYQTINNQAHYIARITPFSRYTSKKQDLLDMQAAHAAGEKVLMLIDADMLSNKNTYTITTTSWHWIVFEGDATVDDAAETYTFSYYSWGQKNNKAVFRQSVFNSNFYGFISGK